ncbi:MAG: hypothetical protein ACODAU_02340 [Myxococcota bacterium]
MRDGGQGRRARGTALIQLVKLLRGQRKKGPLRGLSPQAKALLDEHILPNEWYPLEPFREMMDFLHRELCGSSEEATLQAGEAGGKVLLTGPHKAFIQPGDPAASVFAMRHIWRAYYDFGELSGEMIDGPAVRFTLKGYPDITVAHGLMIAGWGVAAALVAGAADAGAEILERPWDGDLQLVYRVFWSNAE